MQTGKTNEETTAKIMLENILESSTEYSIIGTNSEGIVLVWNQGAMNNYGFHADEMVNKQNISVLYTPEDITSGRVQRFLDKAYQYGKVEGTFEGVRKNKSRFTALINLGLRRDENGVPVGYILISKDITSARLMEEQLIRSNQELEKFAYIASHDLQEPLRSISNFSTLLTQKLEAQPDNKAHEYLTYINGGAKRMSTLIFDLLEYSRIGKDTSKVQIDCNKMVHDIITGMSASIKECEAEIHVAKLPVLSGFIYLESVFQNLISNAIKFRKAEIHPIITISAIDKGKEFLFEIKDNGIGIEKEYYEKIFIIFQRLHTRREYEGTGIGLSQCKKIIELHGGAIWLESELGKGSTFKFTIPKI